MTRLIAQLKLRTVLLMISLIPLLFAFVMSVFWWQQIRVEIQQADQELTTVELGQYLGALSHEMAIERGLTAGFLGSGGQAQQQVAMQQQRQKVDMFVASFKQYASSLPQSHRSLVAEVQATLEQLSSLRADVDRLNGRQSFAYYSELNRLALEAKSLLIASVVSPKTTELMEANLSLMWMKERIGQYRGALNGAFNAKSVSMVNLAEIQRYILDTNLREARFRYFATDELLTRLDSAKSQSHWQQVQQVLSQLNVYQEGNELQGPANWFALATSMIGDIDQISQYAVTTLMQSAESTHDKAVQKQVVAMVSFLFVLGVVLLITMSAIRSINTRVKRINGLLHRVADQSDLTLRLKDSSADELGDIGQSLDKHLSFLAASMQLIASETDSTQKALKQVKTDVSDSLENVKSQADNSDAVATAIQELSYTSQDIAKNMREASDQTRHVNELGIKSSRVSDDVLSAISVINESILRSQGLVQTLKDDFSGVEHILETIRTISEQTNLLALNAAIESARAGDAGRGFAVVADEVRQLAKKTQDSTEQIGQMIVKLNQSSEAALSSMMTSAEAASGSSDLVAENQHAIHELFTAIEKVNSLITQVATAAEEQTAVTEDVSGNVQNVANLAQSTRDRVLHLNASLDQMTTAFGQIAKDVGHYKLR
ncbi:methyl-accepting chemotaxis protein [Nitrincola nitratireducens]|uniref:Methyl-accepting chemotaxis protein 4 n=1 Tax=Nitrincola nitratireducens TaxID=1229521 RepID=W9V1W8_9GAMM|nr:methyl-accepting chemotaxis protein [Nitrincola nitratireducens]EXJ10162.1 Methyl-accepting chemotaxis protein 4 [Nitrincola nitratireducens]